MGMASIAGYQWWTAPPGIAATPPLLTIQPPVTGRPAPLVLAEIADRAAALPAPVTAGRTEKVTIRAWYLHGQVSGGTTISALQAERRELVRRPDGSGTIVGSKEPPEFQSEADRREWASDHGGQRTTTWAAGGRSFFNQHRPPSTVEQLRQYLWRPNPPDSNGSVKTLQAMREVLRERALPPGERAAFLRLMAERPELRHEGRAQDRAGRWGEVFSVDSAYAGLPARYSFLLDADTGAFLGYEHMLTTTPGALNVRVPAVTTYETFLDGTFVD
ncbi:hypothetical protein [Streptoalloteichus hindustanus]|uniref:hypothetical protein n=1 Tax=Streptoalloteichus hindustanus TaxID=2017 RepID=UPI0011611461|nr:hypothetical protein [Streptoalloteichus hindustanus]